MSIPAHMKPPELTSKGLKYSAVFMKNLTWQPYQTVRIGFMDNGSGGAEYSEMFLYDGDPLEEEIQFMTPINIVRTVVMKRIQPFVNLNFVFVTTPRFAQIRISFDSEGGAWSALGRESDFPRHKPSMNLGYLNTTIIIHEFMHALGMGHEHQNPNPGIEWDREVVLAAGRTRYGWDEAKTQLNILDTLEKGATSGSDYDPKSIMVYAFPLEWTKCKCQEQTLNKVLSLQDVEWLVSFYNEGADHRALYERVYGSLPNNGDTQGTQGNGDTQGTQGNGDTQGTQGNGDTRGKGEGDVPVLILLAVLLFIVCTLIISVTLR